MCVLLGGGGRWVDARTRASVLVSVPVKIISQKTAPVVQSEPFCAGAWESTQITSFKRCKMSYWLWLDADVSKWRHAAWFWGSLNTCLIDTGLTFSSHMSIWYHWSQQNQVSLKPLSLIWPTCDTKSRSSNFVKCLYSQRTIVLPLLIVLVSVSY